MRIPVVDPNLPAPVLYASENKAVLYYNRPDGEYDDWKLHIWNGGLCDSYTDEQMDGVTWGNGVVHTGVDPNYGAYWELDLKPEYTDCANYIIHFGDDKEQGGADKIMDLTTDRTNWVLQGVTDTFPTPILKLGVSVSGFAAPLGRCNYLDVAAEQSRCCIGACSPLDRRRSGI